MPGVSIETGDTVWDPMNLAQWRDPSEMRECELKNGRAAMLAVVGWIWPQVFGLWAANDVTTADPIAAIGQVNELAWVQILAACGMVEAADYNFKKTGSLKPFFDPLGLCPTDKAGFEKNAAARAEERAHGDDCLRRPRRPSLPPKRGSRHGQPRLSHNLHRRTGIRRALGPLGPRDRTCACSGLCAVFRSTCA